MSKLIFLYALWIEKMSCYPEMIFNGVFNDVTAQQYMALLACLEFEAKVESCIQFLA